jgi:hypothetical protein
MHTVAALAAASREHDCFERDTSAATRKLLTKQVKNHW